MNMNILRKWLMAMMLAVATVAVNAQNVSFSINSGYNGSNMSQSSIENNITKLLNAIHTAGSRTGSALNLGSVDMEARARTRLLALWENCPFVCEDLNNVFPCITDVEGFQIRGIPVLMKPQDTLYKGQMSREIVVSFNKQGVITGVSLALNNINGARIMGQGNEVRDLTERRMIRKFLEDFRCYYNEKDTAALRAIYSDDAIIITGSVMTPKKMDGVTASKQEIRYNKQNKNQYMQSLKQCFQNNKYINVEFDKIDIVRHPTNAGYYGVTLHQKWDSSRYKDDGWLFLLWDFTDKEKPTIHVRTWQPWMVKENDVFSIDDFRID